MAAYTFKARFVDPIKLGTKRQTIRKARKHPGLHGVVGGPITLNTGPRFTPELIGRSTIENISEITLYLEMNRVLIRSVFDPDRQWNIVAVPAERDAFAIRDGFKDWEDLKKFWRETHNETRLFKGIMTTWGDLLCSL